MTQITGVQTGRLISMVAAFSLCFGLGIFLTPGQFQTEIWVPMAAYFPILSALMSAGAVLLLLSARFQLPSWLRRSIFLLPASGLTWLASYFAAKNGLLATIFFGLMAVATLLAAWLPQEAAYGSSGPDLAVGVVALIDLLAGGLLLIRPDLSLPVLRSAPGMTLWLGLAGLLAGGACLLCYLRPRPHGSWERWRWLPAGLFPVMLGGALLPYSPGDAIATWVTTLVLLSASGRLEPVRPTPGDTAQGLELFLEVIFWTLALVQVVASALVHGGAPRGESVLFVLFVLLYQVLVPWLLRSRIPPRRRLQMHMLFYPLALGHLMLHPDQMAPVYFAVLLILPMGAAHGLGRRAGQAQLAIIVGVLALVEVLEVRMGHLALPHAVLAAGFEILTVAAIGWIGVTRAVEHARTVRELGHREVALTASEERFRRAFQYAPNGMALCSLDGRMLKVNPAFCHTLGYSEAELLGANLLDYHPLEDRPAVLEGIKPLLGGSSAFYEVERRFRHRDGRTLCMLSHAAVVSDARGKPDHLIVQVLDITARKEYERVLAHAADHDSLTGLHNRRALMQKLSEQLRSEGSRGALILVDLDQFKYVNDSLGHPAGDEQLKAVAQLLTGLVGNRGILGRLGGDEFAILLPGVGRDEARDFASQAVTTLGSHGMVIDGRPVSCSASLGVVLYPEHGRSAEELLVLADMAMYRSKEGGRNQFSLWHPGEGFDSWGRLNWERRIRAALEEDRLCLHAQPILDIALGQVTRYELLIRMMEPDGRILRPGSFLPEAERFGLVVGIDRWVIRRAIALIAEMEQAGIALPLEINLSGQSVTDPELLTFLLDELRESRIDPKHLIIEITETSAITDMRQAHLLVERLKELGCQFAIDDFGAGFSSFNYLKRLAVNYLKIDGSLVQGLSADPVNQQLVRAITEMARSMGKRTVAEYVEDEQTLALLRGYGVDFAQGYHIGRPQPIGAELLAAGTASAD